MNDLQLAGLMDKSVDCCKDIVCLLVNAIANSDIRHSIQYGEMKPSLEHRSSLFFFQIDKIRE